MADETAIGWCDSTWNPWWGCQLAGPGCDHCYAWEIDKRFHKGAHWGPGAPRKRTGPDNWRKPVQWNNAAAAFAREHGRRRRVFCGSMMDIFDNAVPANWNGSALRLLGDSGGLDVILLTKRLGNVTKRIPASWRDKWPSHVGLMATVVNQAEADRDVPKLLALKKQYGIPWVGLSIEPMLGEVDLSDWLFGRATPCDGCPKDADCECGPEVTIDWVICGGESGDLARPMRLSWARHLGAQCAAAGVPFFFKQWGEWAPGEWEDNGETVVFTAHDAAVKIPDMGNRDAWQDRVEWEDIEAAPDCPGWVKLGTNETGRMLDGVRHDGFPKHFARAL